MKPTDEMRERAIKTVDSLDIFWPSEERYRLLTDAIAVELSAERARTIEECAQVADRAVDLALFHQEDAGEFSRIATAIRALIGDPK